MLVRSLRAQGNLIVPSLRVEDSRNCNSENVDFHCRKMAALKSQVFSSSSLRRIGNIHKNDRNSGSNSITVVANGFILFYIEVSFELQSTRSSTWATPVCRHTFRGMVSCSELHIVLGLLQIGDYCKFSTGYTVQFEAIPESGSYGSQLEEIC